MKTKKRILIYKIKVLDNNSKFFIKKISSLVKTICIVGCKKSHLNCISNNIEIKYYNNIEKAIYDNQGFDEYIFANDLFYGPFCDLKELFKKMEKYPIWSINKMFYDSKSFFVIKNSYNNENVYFAFPDNFDIDNSIINQNFPFLHKDILNKNKYDFIKIRLNNIFNFIKNKSEYDENIIIDDILNSKSKTNIMNIICLNEIISSKHYYTEQVTNKKIALIIYLHAESLIDYCFNYAMKIPQNVEIYIVTTTKNKLRKIKNKFNNIKNNIQYRIQENRGRDNSALLVTCKDLFDKYDYICFVHSKESKQNKISSDIFRNHCFDALLYNCIYINNIINNFETNPRLGIMMPYPPEFEPYCTIGNEWMSNYQNANNFIKKFLNKKIILDKDNIMCAFGGMFWFRPQAFKTLLSFDLKMNDFSQEPLTQYDGLETHIIERIIPTLAMYDNFYSVYTIPDVKISTYLNTVMTSLKREKQKIYKNINHCL